MGRPPKKISEFDVRLGSVVRSKRAKSGLSRAALADLSGIAEANIKRREMGLNEIMVSELECLADAMGQSAGEMVAEALSDYGGIEKLRREFSSTSEGTATVSAEDNVSYLDRHPMPKKFAAKKKREED